MMVSRCARIALALSGIFATAFAEPSQLEALLAKYPFRSDKGSVGVHSDYGSDASQVYSQAGMIVFYLFTKHPSTMSELIDGLNSGRFRQNDDVVNFLTSTGMTFEQLEQEYVALALFY